MGKVGATHSLFASSSREEQPYLPFLPSLAAAAAVPNASDKKAGSELMPSGKAGQVSAFVQGQGLILQMKPKQMQPRAMGGEQR